MLGNSLNLCKPCLIESADLSSILIIETVLLTLIALSFLIYYLCADLTKARALGRIAMAVLAGLFILYAALYRGPLFVLMFFAATALPPLLKEGELPEDSKVAWAVLSAIAVISLGVLSVLESGSTLRFILWGVLSCALLWGAALLWDLWRNRPDIGDEAEFTSSLKTANLTNMLAHPAAIDHVIDQVDLKSEKAAGVEDSMAFLHSAWGTTDYRTPIQNRENSCLATSRQDYGETSQALPDLSPKTNKTPLQDSEDFIRVGSAGKYRAGQTRREELADLIF